MFNSAPSTPPPSYAQATLRSSQEKLTNSQLELAPTVRGVDYGEDHLVTACRNNDLHYLTNNSKQLRRCIDYLYVNKKEDSRVGESISLLHVACFENNPQVVKLLLEHGANPMIKLPKSGLTPIALACADEQMDSEILSTLAEYLFPQRLDVNAFHCARSPGYPKNFTLLQLACHSQNIQAMTTLLAKQADPNLAAPGWDMSPLHILCKRKQSDEQAFEVLLAAGQVNINATTSEGVTPLMLACRNNAKLAHLLLMNDSVNVHIENFEGSQALHYAALSGHETVIKALIEKEVDVNAKTTKGVTPLHHAVVGKHEEAINVLIDHGADITAKGALNPYSMTGAVGACLCVTLTCPTVLAPSAIIAAMQEEFVDGVPIHERQATRCAQACCPVRCGVSPMELADEESQHRMQSRQLPVTSQPGSLSNTPTYSSEGKALGSRQQKD